MTQNAEFTIKQVCLEMNNSKREQEDLSQDLDQGLVELGDLQGLKAFKTSLDKEAKEELEHLLEISLKNSRNSLEAKEVVLEEVALRKLKT